MLNGRDVDGQHFVDSHSPQRWVDGPGARYRRLGFVLPYAGGVHTDRIERIVPVAQCTQFDGNLDGSFIAPRLVVQSELIVRDTGPAESQRGIGSGRQRRRLAGDRRAGVYVGPDVQAVGSGLEGGRTQQEVEFTGGRIGQAGVFGHVTHAQFDHVGRNDRVVQRYFHFRGEVLQ